MKKIYKNYIEAAIKNDLSRQEDYDVLKLQTFIFKDIIFDAIFRFLFILLFLIYSLLNHDKLVKLTHIAADTILNHEVLINPEAYYFVWMYVLLGLLLVAFIVSNILLGVLKNNYLKRIYNYYKIYDLVIFIASIFVIINFIIMYVITPVTIDGISMKDTLNDKDKVLLVHFAYEPSLDDIVVIDATNYGDDSAFYVKRVVAMPGDKLTYLNSNLYVNDTLLEEHIRLSEWYNITDQRYTEVYTIPDDKYLLFGDNRAHSTDSRYFGLVVKDDIIGKVFLRYYPFSDFGSLDKKVREN